jgi:uncharacterized protein YkwD
LSSARLRCICTAVWLVATAGGTLHSQSSPELASAVEAGEVDAVTAAAAISAERAAHHLPPVAVDVRLMRIAALHARRMAAAGRVTHRVPGEVSFEQRLADGDFPAMAAAENVGGGPPTFAKVLELWNGSPGHAANLLRSGVSKVGIGVAVAPDSAYKVYWSLVLAEDGVAESPDVTDVEVLDTSVSGPVGAQLRHR